MSNASSTHTDLQASYLAEYDELGANYRLFASWTFIVAGFTITIQAAFFTFYGQVLQRPGQPIGSGTITVIGFTTLFASVIIEQRTIQLFDTMIKRGRELEFNLGLSNGQYSRLADLRRPAKGFRRFITHTWGFRLIYGMIGILWLSLFVRNDLPQFLLWVRSLL